MGKFDTKILKTLNDKVKLVYSQLFKELGVNDKPESAENVKDLMANSLINEELVGKQRVALSIKQEGTVSNSNDKKHE